MLAHLPVAASLLAGSVLHCDDDDPVAVVVVASKPRVRVDAEFLGWRREKNIPHLVVRRMSSARLDVEGARCTVTTRPSSPSSRGPVPPFCLCTSFKGTGVLFLSRSLVFWASFSCILSLLSSIVHVLGTRNRLGQQERSVDEFDHLGEVLALPSDTSGIADLHVSTHRPMLKS